jgi:hypothetical protein
MQAKKNSNAAKARTKKLQRLRTITCPRHTPAVAWCAVRHIGGGIHRAVGKAKQQLHGRTISSTQGQQYNHTRLDSPPKRSTHGQQYNHKASVPRQHPPSSPHFHPVETSPQNTTHIHPPFYGCSWQPLLISLAPSTHNPTTPCCCRPARVCRFCGCSQESQPAPAKTSQQPTRAFMLPRPHMTCHNGENGWFGCFCFHSDNAAAMHSPHMKCHKHRLAPPGTSSSGSPARNTKVATAASAAPTGGLLQQPPQEDPATPSRVQRQEGGHLLRLSACSTLCPASVYLQNDI